MSYMKTLDEYSDEELVDELERRMEARASGLCDYCGNRSGVPIKQTLIERGTQEEGNATGASQSLIDSLEDDGVCRFPSRHSGHPVVAPWSLTFDRLSGINRQRCEKWHANMEEWSAADWSNAMQGEAGEAGNKVKKLRRIETTTGAMYKRPEMIALVEEIMEEIADTILYADLLANHLSRDLAPYIVAKFNKVSIERGFEERL